MRSGSDRRADAGISVPDVYEPEMPTLVKSAPEGDAWLHEIKYDGYRIGCRVSGDSVRLITRNGNDWTRSFPEIEAAARTLTSDRVFIDGEAAIVMPDGRTSFQELQGALKARSHGTLVYFVFDILHLDGVDLSPRPLEERKRILLDLLERQPAGEEPVIRYSEHIAGNGPAVFQEACKAGLEGIVSKRRDLPYEHARTRNWLKIKCIRRQEFVIGGFTDPEGSRTGIGALLVGTYRDGVLQYAGKVGTGFNADTLTDLHRRLSRLEGNVCPFEPKPRGLGRHFHWVEPSLVAEVAFTEWTADGKIRHPSFQGIRNDKRADEVVREEPVDGEIANKRAGLLNPAALQINQHTHSPVAGRRQIRKSASAPPSKKTDPIEVAGVRITHPDRMLYPEVGLTKLDLARFYESIADHVLPHLDGRPLTLVRCPEGMGAECFYMKHSKVWAPPALRRVNIQEKKKIGEYLVVDSLPGLIGLVQMDVLEIHTWNSTITHLEQPDRIIFDLDPGPNVSWAQVVDAARLTRSILKRIGLTSFVKTTGGVGLHVVVPLVPGLGWPECFDFSRDVAETIVRLDNTQFSVSIPKRGRESKILIDYLRNNRANTSVAAYSTRATRNASVSTPLSWDELSPKISSDYYTAGNLQRRLTSLKNDPWAQYESARARITAEMAEALRRI